MDKEPVESDQDMAEAARAMGKKRWQGMSDTERREFMAKARAKIKLTKAERSEIGRNAVNARWAKARAAEQTAETADEPKPSAGSSRRGKRKSKRGT
jgi:hypothetical protein